MHCSLAEQSQSLYQQNYNHPVNPGQKLVIHHHDGLTDYLAAAAVDVLVVAVLL